MQTILRFLILMSALLSLAACPGKHKGHGSSQIQSRIVVKGDPNLLIKGAKFRPESPITEANIGEWNNIRLLSTIDFVEKEALTVSPVTQEELEAENKTAEGTANESLSQLLAIKIAQTELDIWTMTFLNGAAVIRLKKQVNGQLQPFELSSNGKTQSIMPLHWSVSQDENFISLLFASETEADGRIISAAYFERPTRAKVVPTTSADYIYSAGPGRLIGWSVRSDEFVEINLCGSGSRTEEIKADVESWSQQLKGRLNVRFSQTNSYYPFSDLNQHCIQITDVYMFDPRENVATYGITLTIRSDVQARTIDSDIFMFSREFAKKRRSLESYGYPKKDIDSEINFQFRSGTVHEIGHFFGLGHKFDGTPSAMSYEFDSTNVRPYDVKALQRLYPLY